MPNIIKGRFVQKHDTDENWLKAISFTPLQGEIIIYDKDATHDYERIKIGDGVTNVNALPFATKEQIQSDWDQVDDTSFDYIKNKPNISDWAKAETKPTYTAAEVGALPSNAEVVKYTAQTLTDEQKAQACANIGALVASETITVPEYVAAADEGKVLAIVDGNPTWVTLSFNVDANGVISVGTSSDEARFVRLVNGKPTWVTLLPTMDENGVITL